MLHIFNFGVASTKMPAVFTSNCPRFLHIYCGPPPLRSMEDGTINSDERGTTSKVSTECPLTKSTHSVSTIDKVHFRESVQWTISPLHALSKGRSLKRADPLLCSKYGTETDHQQCGGHWHQQWGASEKVFQGKGPYTQLKKRTKVLAKFLFT